MPLNAPTSMWVCVALATACAERTVPPVRCDARTPLLSAACAGALADLTRLLDGGADPATRGDHGWTALHWAAAHGHVAAVELLLDRDAVLEARADYDMRPLHWAALRGHAGVVRVLLEARAELEPRNLYGMTPLHEAATGEVASALLDAGAAVAPTDHRGNTPLHLARNPGVARALLDAGADMLAEARDRSRPVDAATATSESRFEIVLQPQSRAIHLAGERGTFRVALRSFATHTLDQLTLALESTVCTARVTPPSVAALHPGQLVVFRLDLSRSAAEPRGNSRLTLRGRDEPMMFVDLEVDDRRPDERNRITVGRVRVQPESRWQLLAYLAVPVVLLLAWLVVRAKRAR